MAVLIWQRTTFCKTGGHPVLKLWITVDPQLCMRSCLTWCELKMSLLLRVVVLWIPATSAQMSTNATCIRGVLLHGSHIKYPRASQVPGRHPTVQPAELCSHLLSLWYQQSLSPIPAASAGAKAEVAFALPLGLCLWLTYCRAYIQHWLQSGSNNQVLSSCAKGGIKM